MPRPARMVVDIQPILMIVIISEAAIGEILVSIDVCSYKSVVHTVLGRLNLSLFSFKFRIFAS